jgi:hypothetical protein
MVSNSNEEALSGEKENAVMANADTNTGSSVSKLAYIWINLYVST